MSLGNLSSEVSIPKLLQQVVDNVVVDIYKVERFDAAIRFDHHFAHPHFNERSLGLRKNNLKKILFGVISFGRPAKLKTVHKT